MPKTTRVLHNGHEFLLLDERHRGGPRTITFMVRPDDPTFRKAVGQGLMPTPLGQWAPIGIWDSSQCRPVQTAGEPWVSTMKEITETYLKEGRALHRKTGIHRYWRPCVLGETLYSLHPNHPHGLTLPIFSNHNSARAAARRERGSLEKGEKVTQAVDDLFVLLVEMARAGFAGALLDDREPIYFCSDENQRFQFLRLNLGDDGSIEESLLNDGVWEPFEGTPRLEIFVDEAACELAMVRHLGEIPFHGFQPSMAFFCLIDPKSGLPLCVQNTDGWGAPESLRSDRHEESEDFGDDWNVEAVEESQTSELPIFHNVEAASEYLRIHSLEDIEMRQVESLRALVELAQSSQAVPRLQPEAHRALGGTFWMRDEGIVLDSFSGFWFSSDDGMNFTREPPT